MEDEINSSSSNNKVVIMPISKRGIFLNVIIHLILFFITVYVTFQSFANGIHLFSWHPTLMTIGYLILMSHAILTMSDSNYFTYQLGFKSRIELHWILQTTAAILISIGSAAIIVNKVYAEKNHFETIHSIFGVITYITTLITIGGGVITKYSLKWKSYIRPVTTKILHSFAGILCYILAITTIMLGLNSIWFRKTTKFNYILGFYILIVITSMYVLVKPVILLLNRFKSATNRNT